MKLIKLYPHMSGEQKRLIEGAGFHGLVDLKCSKLRPDLCSWLMEHFNPATNQLVFPRRGAIDVNEESVKSVLGIPMGDKDVSYEMESEATEFVLNLLGINDGMSPSLISIGIQLEKLKLVDDKYLRMWIIYSISSVLAPTTATTVSPRCYPSVVDAGNIKNLNWCKFVISTLQKAAKAGKNTNSACLLYMMLRSSFQHEGTRLFGSNLDFSTFINSNVPNTMQQQEKDRIVITVQNLCEGFSSLVTKFVRQISGLDFMDPRGVTSSDDEDFVADEDEVEDTEEDEYTNEDGDSDDDEDEGEEDDDDEGEEDDDEDRSENDDNDGAETARSVPNFNLDFDSSQEVVQTPKGQEAAGTSRGKEFPGIITNEDYGSFTTEDYEKVGREADEAIANKSATTSPIAEVISKEAIADDCEVEEETPVPHEYNKRVVKPAKFKRSPFIDYENKKQFVFSRVINEVYGDICKNGGRTKSRRNSLKIIDTGEYYIYLGDLANSFKPMGSLDNNTCELALIVLSADIKDNSKIIFPARIGLDRNELKKHFDQTRANRLDHKELAFFPILQELCNGNDKAGHYFVVCLNLKAERFEVYDSLRGEDDEELISATSLVVASIKTMWDRVYMRSSKKTIQNYPLIFIDGPKQDNIRDCGFYMLKFVELWVGKQLPAFEQGDIPNIKKLLAHKMLSFQGNRVQWMQVLWGKHPDPTLKNQ
uniref:Ubiquitin-like protease family profile domain-containing protein n=1 Tax=Oryza punctata TaxID=4537 RepID=A0A0E0LY82_ORYPU